MAKIDSIKIGKSGEKYEINLPTNATPTISGITITNSATLPNNILIKQGSNDPVSFSFPENGGIFTVSTDLDKYTPLEKFNTEITSITSSIGTVQQSVSLNTGSISAIKADLDAVPNTYMTKSAFETFSTGVAGSFTTVSNDITNVKTSLGSYVTTTNLTTSFTDFESRLKTSLADTYVTSVSLANMELVSVGTLKTTLTDYINTETLADKIADAIKTDTTVSSALSDSINRVITDADLVTSTALDGKGYVIASDVTTIVSEWIPSAPIVSQVIVERITTSLTPITTSIERITGSITTISEDLVTISGEIITISGNIETVSGRIVTLSGEVATISGDIKTISGNIISINSDISTISGDIKTISGNIVSITSDITTISGRFKDYVLTSSLSDEFIRFTKDSTFSDAANLVATDAIANAKLVSAAALQAELGDYLPVESLTASLNTFASSATFSSATKKVLENEGMLSTGDFEQGLLDFSSSATFSSAATVAARTVIASQSLISSGDLTEELGLYVLSDNLLASFRSFMTDSSFSAATKKVIQDEDLATNEDLTNAKADFTEGINVVASTVNDLSENIRVNYQTISGLDSAISEYIQSDSSFTNAVESWISGSDAVNTAVQQAIENNNLVDKETFTEAIDRATSDIEILSGNIVKVNTNISTINKTVSDIQDTISGFVTSSDFEDATASASTEMANLRADLGTTNSDVIAVRNLFSNYTETDEIDTLVGNLGYLTTTTATPVIQNELVTGSYVNTTALSNALTGYQQKATLSDDMETALSQSEAVKVAVRKTLSEDGYITAGDLESDTTILNLSENLRLVNAKFGNYTETANLSTTVAEFGYVTSNATVSIVTNKLTTDGYISATSLSSTLSLYVLSDNLTSAIDDYIQSDSSFTNAIESWLSESEGFDTAIQNAIANSNLVGKTEFTESMRQVNTNIETVSTNVNNITTSVASMSKTVSDIQDTLSKYTTVSDFDDYKETASNTFQQKANFTADFEAAAADSDAVKQAATNVLSENDVITASNITSNITIISMRTGLSSAETKVANLSTSLGTLSTDLATNYTKTSNLSATVADFGYVTGTAAETIVVNKLTTGSYINASDLTSALSNYQTKATFSTDFETAAASSTAVKEATQTVLNENNVLTAENIANDETILAMKGNITTATANVEVLASDVTAINTDLANNYTKTANLSATVANFGYVTSTAAKTIVTNTLSEDGYITSSDLDSLDLISNSGLPTLIDNYITEESTTSDSVWSNAVIGAVSDSLSEFVTTGSYASLSSLVTSITSEIYYITSDVSDLLSVVSDISSTFVSEGGLSDTLASYITSSTLSNTLGSYTTASGLVTALTSYVTSAALTTSLSSYATAEELSSYATTSTLNNYLLTADLKTELTSAGVLGITTSITTLFTGSQEQYIATGYTQDRLTIGGSTASSVSYITRYGAYNIKYTVSSSATTSTTYTYSFPTASTSGTLALEEATAPALYKHVLTISASTILYLRIISTSSTAITSHSTLRTALNNSVALMEASSTASTSSLTNGMAWTCSTSTFYTFSATYSSGSALWWSSSFPSSSTTYSDTVYRIS